MIILLTELKYMQNYFIPFNPMHVNMSRSCTIEVLININTIVACSLYIIKIIAISHDNIKE